MRQVSRRSSMAMGSRWWCVVFCAITLPIPACIAAELPCDPVDISLLTPHVGVMLGEVHGTTQAPQFVGRALCTIAHTGRPVVLALEYPRAEQVHLDAFFSNHDLHAAAKQLLQTPFWSQVPGDGRESQGWFTLLRDVHAWKEQGLPITVVAYDYESPRTANDREAHNAAYLEHLLEKARGGTFVIIYSGNVHAKKIRGLADGSDDSYESMGYRLRHWDMLHLNIGTPGGTAWICTTFDRSSCGPHPWPGTVTEQLKPYSIHLGYRSRAFDGVYAVGTLTASPPARGPNTALTEASKARR